MRADQSASTGIMKSHGKRKEFCKKPSPSRGKVSRKRRMRANQSAPYRNHDKPRKAKRILQKPSPSREKLSRKRWMRADQSASTGIMKSHRKQSSSHMARLQIRFPAITSERNLARRLPPRGKLSRKRLMRGINPSIFTERFSYRRLSRMQGVRQACKSLFFLTFPPSCVTI